MSDLDIRPEEFAERQQKTVAMARERGFEGLLVWSRGGTTVDYYGDVFYLTNHHSPYPAESDTIHWSGRSYSALVLPVEGEPILIVDIPDYPEDRVFVDDIRSTLHLPRAVAQALRERGLDRAKIGLVGRDTLLLSNFRTIEGELDRELAYEPADDILESLRQVKSEGEIRHMRHAAEVGVGWVNTMMEAIEIGRTEGEIVGEGLRYLAAHGGYPYDIGVASGPNSHHFERIGIPSWDSIRKLEAGDLIHIDAWGPVDSYFTDFARSTVVGRPPSESQLGVLEASIAIVEHMLEGVRPGATGEDIYLRGASWLADNGFGSQTEGSEEAGTYYLEVFPSFGHAIGLGLESPWIMEGDATKFKENMVLAIEAMIGDPEIGAAQFEQNLIVTGDGCEVITSESPSRWWQ